MFVELLHGGGVDKIAKATLLATRAGDLLELERRGTRGELVRDRVKHRADAYRLVAAARRENSAIERSEASDHGRVPL